MLRKVDWPPSWEIFSPARWRSLAEESTRRTNIPEHGVKLPACNGNRFWHSVSALVLCARFPEEPAAAASNCSVITLVLCARFLEEPAAVIPHAGICEGAPSNRCRYLNRQKKKMRFTEKHIP